MSAQDMLSIKLLAHASAASRIAVAYMLLVKPHLLAGAFVLS